ncbi:sulfatase-like hydrolase/transferase [Paenibacillus oleatilyticus]|uniref:sulfatase-like hydrolase/transferase n=1 Tax=Paenibacillus oleatilyticus TaxID=2594886 RepID=UPI001C1FEC92|nr:sulfatase-like hydrolase/transferase [Paenibacillus oleatilyticus]MBU7320899.1 sulfatase-like hydrolase/transferase [Paenibacillus oleatilyticus]
MPLFFRLTALTCGLFLLIMLQASVYIRPPVPLPPPKIEIQTEWSPEELQKPPNIIILLSEAFWDITQIKSLQFSEDPAPMFHALQEKFTHGTLLSPMFGGGTANVELEVLTGHSMRFFPEDSTPYEQYIKQPTASLASLLAGQGYKTTAISPFYHWFFNSSEVYKHLGFSRFISLEYFNPDEYVGPYIGDHAVVRRIIEESERNPGPDFIFANTMENHYHYWPGKFKKNHIEVKSHMSNAVTGIAETYAQGLSGADRALQELVLHFSRLKEPTIIVFFGDHLPSLEKLLVYKESNYISGEDDPDFLEKMHNTPVVIWSNYLPEEAKEELHMSPSFLGPYILNLAKRPGSPYMDFLSDLYRKMPVLPPKTYYEAMNIDVNLVQQYEDRQKAILALEKQAAAGSGNASAAGVDTAASSDASNEAGGEVVAGSDGADSSEGSSPAGMAGTGDSSASGAAGSSDESNAAVGAGAAGGEKSSSTGMAGTADSSASGAAGSSEESNAAVGAGAVSGDESSPTGMAGTADSSASGEAGSSNTSNAAVGAGAAGGDTKGKTFILGYGEPLIERVSPAFLTIGGDAFGRSQLTVHGGRYGLGSTVFINGEPQQTTWQSESSLSVNVPKALTANAATLDVQVRVIDSKNRVLAESQIVKVPVQEKKR